MVAVTRRYLLIFSLSTVWALGQTKKPNFSGRWRMVKGKSELRGFKTPDIIVRSVEHRDPTLNLHTVQTTGTKTAISDISYFTDGATANNVINGRNASSRAYWDGPALVINTEMKNSKGEAEQIEDRWELSEDGQTLTTRSHIVTEKGEANLVLVCSKEAANP
jgi:hypothetical protein